MGRTQVRWGRLGALFGLASVVVTLLMGAAGADAGPRQTPVPRVYTVRPGDTLWGIAARFVGPAGDPRPMVDRLIRLNGVRDAVIRPGQELRLAP